MKKKPNIQPNSPAMQKAFECIEAFRSTGTKTDLQGSYTGIFKDAENTMGLYGVANSVPYDKIMLLDDIVPVQDMDDI